MAVDKSKYVVLDLETNGIHVDDDILSISIYKPDEEIMFNKFLPLERSKSIKTTHINGITANDLKDAKALTQQEVFMLIEKFELNSRTILTYSNFDERMLRYYFKRKGLYGFERFHFYNFKRDVISSRYSDSNNVTKDNLCELYGIENISRIHSSYNDCILEWKLFEKMDGKRLFITNNNVFEMNNEYIIPISYFSSHPNLKRYVSNFPYIEIESQVIKRFELFGKGIKRFESNINGVLIEHLINSMLNAEKQDSMSFLLDNKSKLKYIGTLPTEIYEMPLYFKEDGTVDEVNSRDKEKIHEFNQVIQAIKSQFMPLIEYIAHDIFEDEKIISQELVIHKEENILALCDLSTKSAVMEIKTNYYPNIFMFKDQLYFEANGRKCYLLQIDWSNMPEVFAIEVLCVNLFLGEPPENKRSLTYRTNHFRSKLSNDKIEVVNYFDTKSKVTLKCKICEHEWETTYYSATNNIKCPFCEPKERKPRKEKISEEERIQLRAANYVYKLLQKSKGCITAKNYVGARERVNAECLSCGYVWNIRADHLQDRPHCPRCKANKNS